MIHVKKNLKKMIQINVYNRKRLTDLEKELTCMYTLLYLKWTTNNDLLYSTWNSAQCYMAAWMGEGFGGDWIHVYMYG